MLPLFEASNMVYPFPFIFFNKLRGGAGAGGYIFLGFQVVYSQ